MAKEKKKVEKEKNYFKNYVLLGLLFLGCVILTLYICKCYEVYDNHQKQTPVIRDTLFEITEKELSPYIAENPTTIIYMCTSANEKCRNYEKDFKKLIEKYELQDEFVYLNLTGVDKDKFISDFNDEYNYKVKLTKNYPAIVLFEDNEIKYILQGKKEEPLTISKTKQFIDLNKIGE